MHFWKSRNVFLGIILTIVSAFFSGLKPTQASAPLNSTFSATAYTGTLGTIRQVRVDPADGSVYVLGSSTTTLGLMSADGTTFTNLNYTAALPNSTGSDLVVSNGRAFIVTSFGATNALYRYDISGGTATLVANRTLTTGSPAITRDADTDTLYVSKSTTLTSFDEDLNSVAPTTTLSYAATRLAYGGTNLFYLSTTGRFMGVISGFETTIATGGPTSVTVKGLTASNDGSTLYYASNSTLGKLLVADGTVLWTKSISNLSGIDVNTSTGRITTINSSGSVSTYNPISPVATVSASASGTAALLTWNPDISDSDFRGVTIVRSASSYPTSVSDGTVVTSSSMDTNFLDTGLSEGTYYYSFFNQTLDGYYSTAATSSVTIDLPPEAPVLAALTVGSTVQLIWSIPADTDSFVLRRGTSGYPATYSDGTAVTTTGNTVTDLTETDVLDGTYYYSLFAADAGGNYSTAGMASVIVDTTGPSAPTLSVTASGSTASLSWDTPLTTATFLLRHSTSNFPATTSDGSAVTSTTATAISQVNLPDGVHYYSLFARDSYGNYSNAGTASVLIDTLAPATPTGFSAVANGSTINLTWSNPVDSDFASSIIRRSTTGFVTSITDGTAVTSTASTSYVDPSLTDGTYYYSIFAVDTTGNASTYITTSATVNTYVPPAVSGGGGSPASIAPSAVNTAPLGFSIHSGSRASVAATVLSPVATLQLNANPTTVRGYATSLDPFFKHASIFPLNPSGQATVSLPDKAGIYTVYLKYYSITGQSSEVFTQTVTYAPAQNSSYALSEKIDPATILRRFLQQVSKETDVRELQMLFNTPGFTEVKKGVHAFGAKILVLTRAMR